MATTTKAPRTYAEDTTVPVSRSKAEIEELVTKHGATKFATGNDSERGIYGVTFEIKTGEGPRPKIPWPECPQCDGTGWISNPAYTISGRNCGCWR